jgi:hypothetical protein
VSRAFVLFAVSTAVLFLSGCNPFRDQQKNCRINPAYLEATVISPLKVPEGLEEPDPNMAMPVPDGPRKAVVTYGDGICLERPPAYYAQPGAPNPEGLPVAQLAMVEPSPMVQGMGQGDSGGSGPVLIPGASVLTNQIAQLLVDWAGVWSQRDVDAYFSFYTGEFSPAGYRDHEDWRQTQRERFTFPAVTLVDLDSLEVEAQPDGSARAVFVQRFGEAPNYRSVLKEMELTEGGPAGWQIRSERILDVL